MSRPKAYDPQPNQRYQMLCRNGAGAWEHCDYAADLTELKHLRREYRMAYGAGWEFKTILLPFKFWPKRKAV